jgi:rhamnogalacturonyl hydrolase YesR
MRAFNSLDGRLRKSEFKGFEFDDYLASPIVRFFCFGNLLLQRVAVQIGKLNPVNIRPLLGIPKLESTKARGFIAKGHLAMYEATGDRKYLEEAESHLDWLLAHPSPGYSGLSWGNAFDFASRGGFFPKGRPTIVWTSHIAETFALAYELTSKSEYANAVKGAGDFILLELERHEDEHGHCFAYAPGLLNLVHNSNLLGAATLLRAWRLFPEEKYLVNSRKAYEWSLAHQNEDGGWYYGAESKYLWIDNFHTAYNIECFLTVSLRYSIGRPSY